MKSAALTQPRVRAVPLQIATFAARAPIRARCAAGSASKFSAESRIWTTGGAGSSHWHASSRARLCRHVTVFGFGVGVRASRRSYRLCYGHYYDDVPCNHGHSKIEAEFQLALQDALGLFQYVWY